MQFGITTRSFPGMSTAETARRMKEAGFVCCELCFVQSDLGGWVYNGRADLTDVTPERVREAADVYRAEGIKPVSLGVFTDLRSPDRETLDANILYFKRYCEFAAEAGIGALVSECGFTPGARGINADTYEADFARLKETLAQLCAYAAPMGLTIALEACVLDVVPSPRRLRTLADQLEAEYGATNFGALTDVANFIAAADEDDIVKYLGGMTCYYHGKDRRLNDAYGRNFGEGEIDWARFFTCYRRLTPDTPFIFEYCGADNCAATREAAEKIYDSVKGA